MVKHQGCVQMSNHVPVAVSRSSLRCCKSHTGSEKMFPVWTLNSILGNPGIKKITCWKKKGAGHALGTCPEATGG